MADLPCLSFGVLLIAAVVAVLRLSIVEPSHVALWEDAQLPDMRGKAVLITGDDIDYVVGVRQRCKRLC